MNIVVVVLLLIVGFFFMWKKRQEQSVVSLAQEAFQEELAQQEGVLIDVRTDKEFQAGHIAGAHHMDVLKRNFKQEVLTLDKDKPIYLYCRSGKRGRMAANKLQKMGFEKVVNLSGGISSWTGKLVK
ncbi:MAG: rhodanese-like domain-containing protein [Bacteroidota bacterium]